MGLFDRFKKDDINYASKFKDAYEVYEKNPTGDNLDVMNNIVTEWRKYDGSKDINETKDANLLNAEGICLLITASSPGVNDMERAMLAELGKVSIGATFNKRPKDSSLLKWYEHTCNKLLVEYKNKYGEI